jgi:hypothetical protein
MIERPVKRQKRIKAVKTSNVCAPDRVGTGAYILGSGHLRTRIHNILSGEVGYGGVFKTNHGEMRAPA